MYVYTLYSQFSLRFPYPSLWSLQFHSINFPVSSLYFVQQLQKLITKRKFPIFNLLIEMSITKKKKKKSTTIHNFQKYYTS